jgi:hypothetical protein
MSLPSLILDVFLGYKTEAFWLQRIDCAMLRALIAILTGYMRAKEILGFLISRTAAKRMGIMEYLCQRNKPPLKGWGRGLLLLVTWVVLWIGEQRTRNSMMDICDFASL